MTKQEISSKVQNFLQDNIKNKNVTIYEFAESIGVKFRTLQSYLYYNKTPDYAVYMKIYYRIYGFDSEKSELMARQAFDNVIDAIINLHNEGYTYLRMEAVTGVSHSTLYKYVKRKVDDIGLYTLVVLIERLNLVDISIPGIIERKTRKQ